MLIQFENDDSIPSYGFWRCSSCGNEFYGGGRAIHKDHCEQSDYTGCIWVFGPTVDRCPDALLPYGVTREAIANERGES